MLYTVVLLSSVRTSKRDGSLDERDRQILSRSPNAQPAAVLLAHAAWMICLTEKFRDPGAVPVVYLYWIFGSVVLVNIIAQAIGILWGYWQVARHGES